jgi:hypothetical protein
MNIPISQRQRTLENGQVVLLDWFTYQVPVFQDLAAGAQGSQQVVIQADADFEWIAAAYEYDLAGAAYVYNTRPMPNMSVLIVDGGSGRQLSNVAVPVTSIFGRPEQPFILPITRTYKANATIQFTVTNFDAATATGRLRLSLIGMKQFYMG